ncbi:hypothetical protein [Streptomyces rubiginosohelvolus]|uniref:hypothetical protein n=1 Tax=Streptomyces rubiginosohelvolus TaxID=67362 RepID=UPI0036651FCD
MNPEVKIMATASASSFVIFVWACIDMMLGNPTAINGAIAFGVGFAICAACAVSLWDDKPVPTAHPKPDYDRIAALEVELGIVEAPPQRFLRRVERRGETVEYRTWTDLFVDMGTYEHALAEFDERRKK